MENSFRVRGKGDLLPVIEMPLQIRTTSHDSSGPEQMRGLASYRLTNADRLNLNDDGSFTNIRTKDSASRVNL
jgi:hypothetical protein